MEKTNDYSENKYKPWTSTEVNFLRVNYGKMTAKEISERLQRPIQAVYGKVKSEKIKRAIKIKKVATKASTMPKVTPQEVNPPIEKSTPKVEKSVKSAGKKCSISLAELYPMIMSTMAFLIAAVLLVLHFIH